MGIEKEGSKGGGSYVGGFFQLFDWKAKSRKKLFSNKSDFPERSKQGKRNDGNFPMTRYPLLDEDEMVAGSSIKGSSDYSCASSVTDDDMCGSRAPGVVARLMGLDSLPTSSTEPFSTPFFDTQSLRDAHCPSRSHSYHHDQQMMYSGNLFRKEEGLTRNFLESKPQKTVSKPIEKFQTESLPPKSAKSIPITHHKLLSPIKSPGFIPSKNAAHIMEAAARIIDPGPQATVRAKLPLVGSSSVPLKVRDLKEKMEASQKMSIFGSSSVPLKARDLKERVEGSHKISKLAETNQRPVESNAAKYLKGQSLNKSWNGSTDTSSLRSSDLEESSSISKNQGKSISLAVQAKVNVQKREGLTSSSTRSLLDQKDQGDVKSSQPFKSQSNIRKNLQKKTSIRNASGALRQNNQKQNCFMDKEKTPSKPMVMQGRKVRSGDSSFVRNKTSSKAVGNSKSGSRKLSLDVSDCEKGVPYSGTKNLPRKKRMIDGDFQLERNQAADNFLIDKNNLKVVQTNSINDKQVNWVEDSKKKGMDVVSFTFTAPLAKPMEATAQTAQRNDNFSIDNRNKRSLLDAEGMNLSSLGYNVIGGDALSMLLEQKLRELSCAVESSCHESVKAGSTSSASICGELAHTPDTNGTASRMDDKLGCYYSNNLSSDLPMVRLRSKFKGADDMDECTSSHQKVRQPSPVSILEHSFSTDSCNSSDSADTISMEVSGSKHCSSVQAQEFHGLSSLKKMRMLEADMDLSDSASSTFSGTLAKSNVHAVFFTQSMKPNNWEMDYVKQILCNVELMFKDFALGRAREIINPHLFDQLECRRAGFGSEGEDSKLNRKELFDCVSECIDLRCRQFAGGGCKTWAKGVTVLRSKERLAEEVYKEISGWRGMGDCMVDELVDKDMSNQYGKWLDFEADAFELGAEVEGQILNGLVNEVVADFLRF